MKYLLFFIFLSGSTFVSGQEQSPIANSKEEHDKIYANNILKTKINGVYIPRDEQDAFEQINKLSDDNAWDKFKSGPEDLVVKNLKLGLGRWMEVNWHLHEGSRLSHFLKEKGLRHPEDMAAYLMYYFHRSLNEVAIEEGQIIEMLNEKRRIEAEKQIESLEQYSNPIPK